jgi:hypothetical protein
MNEQELFEQFEREFRALENHPGVTLQLSAVEAWCLLCQIQLACRHPGNTGPSRRIAEAAARVLQALVATGPALHSIAERGWTDDGPAAPDQP